MQNDREVRTVKNVVTENSFREELAAMLAVCFEGKLVFCAERTELILPSGERFIVYAQKVD